MRRGQLLQSGSSRPRPGTTYLAFTYLSDGLFRGIHPDAPGQALTQLACPVWRGSRRVTGAVVGAEYSPIHSSFHAWSNC
jgi:hypothetical protein